MFCGRACEYERLEFRCESTGSAGSYHGAGNHVGIGHYSTLESWFDTQIGPVKGFTLYCGSSITDQWPHGTDVQKSYYGGAQGPWGVIETSGEEWRDVTTTVTFLNYRVYATADGIWRTKYDGVEVKVNGAVIGTGPAYDGRNNTFIAPNSVPVYSGCLYCEHTGQADWYGATGYILNEDAKASAQGDGTFGVRWMIEGQWLTTPLAMPPRTQYASGGDSWGFTLNTNTFKEEQRRYDGPSEDCTFGGEPYDTYMLTFRAEDGGANNGWLFPNPPRSTVRMNDEDYEALVLRYGSYGWEDRLQTDPNPQDGGRTFLNDTYEVVHETRSPYLARVTNAAHVFEDVLQEPTRCWVNEAWSQAGPHGYLAIAPPGVTVLATDRALYPPCGNAEHDRRSFTGPFPSPRRVYSFPGRFTGAPIAGNLSGWAPWGTYFNTIGSPHYSYFLYFPQGGEWRIDGNSVSSEEYWYPARQQLIDHPELSGTRHMSDVLAEPIDQNGLTGLIQQSSNMPCYWGIGRFEPQKIQIANSVTLDAASAPRWTFEDGLAVGVGGSGVAVPANQNKVSFALSSYTVKPYQLPHLAKEIETLINDPSVEAIKVYLVAGDGQPERTIDGTTYPAVPPTRVLIGESATGGRWPMPKGDSKQWLTTAAYDGGLDDGYTRIAPTKDDGSPNMVAGATANVTLGSVAPTRTGVRIDWEFERKEGAEGAAITLPFPTFYLHDEATQKHIKEAARHAALLMPNGPVTRYGGGGFFDYGADSIVSSLLPEPAIDRAPMAGDWLAFKRPWFLGQDAQDGLSAEIASIYEQGTEYTTDKHLWRDPFDRSLVTHSFIAENALRQPIACLVNSYSAIPPTGAMPSRKRSLQSDWKATGAVGCFAYSLVSHRKYVVGPQPLKVYRQGDPSYANLLTGDSIRIPEGWFGGWFSPEQQDDPVFVVRDQTDNPKDWYKSRGWRGALTILGYAKILRGEVSCDVAGHNRHVVGRVQEGKVSLWFPQNHQPTELGEPTATSVEADSLCLRWQRDVDETLALVASKDDQITYRTSQDEGATFTMPTTIASGQKPKLLISKSGLRYYYWLVKNGDAYDIQGQIRSGGNDVLKDGISVKSGVDEDGFDVREAFTSEGGHLIVIDYVEGGTVKSTASKNGIADWS